MSAAPHSKGVTPILKPGSLSDPSSFRPISIIPAIAKIVEKVVQLQLYHYFSANHLLAETQHGFRPGHSTETALINVTDRILTATDSGKISLLCLLDLSKCFDVIDHSKLLLKLAQYSVDTSWFSSYLRGHTQSVSFSDTSGRKHTSKKLPNSMGVFQGSSLGPLLYSIFSNDVSLFTENADIIQYADDTQVLISGSKSLLPDLIRQMESTLCSLDSWLRANSLKVNASKTQLVLFGSEQNLRNVPLFTVMFREAQLSPVPTAKNLGVTFDRTLSWNSHVSVVTNRCTGLLIGLAHLRSHLPPRALRTVVPALVLPHIRYCLSVYGNGSKSNLIRLQRVLNFAAKLIFGRRKFDRASDLLQRLGWLSAGDMVALRTLTLARQVLRGGEPVTLASAFVRHSESRSRSTRQDRLFKLPRPRTQAGKRTFLYRASAGLNQLPPDSLSLSTGRFKSAVVSHLKSGAT